MANKLLISVVTAGGLVAAAGAKHLYTKYKNFKTDIQVTKAKNELNDKIIDSQDKYIKELETKLKKMESK